ncbi:MAG: molybdopterin-dependent oxidoreductase [Actinomycetota bacterium]|nr:molybdopterin-dependent oxidoreductase [Actinomycetota bacterium]
MRAPDPVALVPKPTDFTSRLRGPEVTSRVGLWLGICFLIAFVTGLYSHFQQDMPGWLTLPTRPVSLYRVTQGLHVIAGSAAVPLLLVKLWSVFPKLFDRLDLGNVRRLGLQLAERGSIALLISAAIFQLSTGLLNTTHWYPWDFSFRATHYAVGWVAIGSLLVHIAVKLPVIRDAITGPVDGPPPPDDRSDDEAGSAPMPTETSQPAEPVTAGHGTPGLSRRGLLRATWLATGVVVLSTAGATVPLLRKISIFGVRDGDGPQGVPINKSAAAAGVTDLARDPGYQLELVSGDRSVKLSLDELIQMPQTDSTLPIACVEGWSATGDWRGVRLRDLLDLVDAPADVDVVATSLQKSGAFRSSQLPSQFVEDPLTLLALRLNGEPLSIDHGFPCRVIAPNRPGVLQTKWVAKLEVLA